MVRSLSYRLLACLLAITSGFAVPGTALAHGYDHRAAQVAGDDHHADHHADHHGAGHHDIDRDDHHAVAEEHSPSTPLTSSAEEALEELPISDGREHFHPGLDRTRSSRVECPAFVPVFLPVVLSVEVREATPPPLEIRVERRPSALTHAPPPPTRAPPTALG